MWFETSQLTWIKLFRFAIVVFFQGLVCQSPEFIL
jgi:hypothetical protein